MSCPMQLARVWLPLGLYRFDAPAHEPRADVRPLVRVLNMREQGKAKFA